MVTFRAVIDSNGLADLQQAINYYEEKQKGLGERFLYVVQLHVDIIAANPYYKVLYKDYRALYVKKFPFIIVYYIVEQTKTVYISSIFHTSQNPDKLPL